MNINDLDNLIREKEGMALSAAFPALMRKVYVWMTMALAISGVMAYAVAASPGLLQAHLRQSDIYLGAHHSRAWCWYGRFRAACTRRTAR